MNQAQEIETFLTLNDNRRVRTIDTIEKNIENINLIDTENQSVIEDLEMLIEESNNLMPIDIIKLITQKLIDASYGFHAKNVLESHIGKKVHKLQRSGRLDETKTLTTRLAKNNPFNSNLKKRHGLVLSHFFRNAKYDIFSQDYHKFSDTIRNRKVEPKDYETLKKIVVETKTRIMDVFDLISHEEIYFGDLCRYHRAKRFLTFEETKNIIALSYGNKSPRSDKSKGIYDGIEPIVKVIVIDGSEIRTKDIRIDRISAFPKGLNSYALRHLNQALESVEHDESLLEKYYKNFEVMEQEREIIKSNYRTMIDRLLAVPRMTKNNIVLYFDSFEKADRLYEEHPWLTYEQKEKTKEFTAKKKSFEKIRRKNKDYIKIQIRFKNMLDQAPQEIKSPKEFREAEEVKYKAGTLVWDNEELQKSVLYERFENLQKQMEEFGNGN